MMLPEEFYTQLEEFMKDPEFPFKNITTCVIVATLAFQEGFSETAKKSNQRNAFVSEIIKLCRYLIKQGIISDKLYGWKDGFREKV